MEKHTPTRKHLINKHREKDSEQKADIKTMHYSDSVDMQTANYCSRGPVHLFVWHRNEIIARELLLCQNHSRTPPWHSFNYGEKRREPVGENGGFVCHPSREWCSYYVRLFCWVFFNENLKRCVLIGCVF